MPRVFDGSEEVQWLVNGDVIEAVLADLARVLGYRDAKNAARVVRPKDLRTHRMSTASGTREMLMVSEAGIYRLIMRSNKPAAQRFQDWVTDEVLPSLRRNSSYSVSQGPSPEIRPWIKRRAKKYGHPATWKAKQQKDADGNKAD